MSELPGGDEILGRCERLVSLALSRGAHQAEAYWEAEADLGLEVESGKVSSSSGSRSQGGSLRVVERGRVGFAYLTDWGASEATAERALAAARAMPEKGYRLPTAHRIAPQRKGWDASLAQLEADVASRLVHDMLDAAKTACPKGVVSGGGVGLSAGVWAIASSEGAAVHDRGTSLSAGCSVVLEQGASSVSASDSTEHWSSLDAAAVGARAGEVTQSLRNPKPLRAGGRLDLVLEPEVAHETLVGLAVDAALGDEAMRGKTVWSGKLGAEVANPALILADDPLHTEAWPGAACDGEGLPARRNAIVEGGRMQGYLFDSWDAHQHRLGSSHNAVRGGFKSPPSTGTQFLVHSSTAARPLEALIAGVDDGLLVDSVLGAHTANATTGEFSVTSPNVWRIHKGALDGPVKEVAIAGSLGEWARQAEATSTAIKRDGSWMGGHLLVRGASVSV